MTTCVLPMRRSLRLLLVLPALEPLSRWAREMLEAVMEAVLLPSSASVSTEPSRLGMRLKLGSLLAACAAAGLRGLAKL
jgi:hypothetical protein